MGIRMINLNILPNTNKEQNLIHTCQPENVGDS